MKYNDLKKIRMFLLLFLLSLLLYTDNIFAGRITVIEVEKVINPVVAEFISQSIDRSVKDEDICFIIRLDTPGGLDSSMRDIAKKILNSPVPIVVYVSPSGARAASAGVIITMAANIAAMAPGTNIGAAHPVAMGQTKMDETMSEKVENDAAAYIESIAHKRGRNAKWAVKAVRESASITEKEALKKNVIDIIATNIDDLLRNIDGREVETPQGKKIILTKNVDVSYKDMAVRQKILYVISRPEIALYLLMLGLAGLYFELSHPGVIFPGVIGAICLILAFYSLQTLPTNYAGILLILLSLILFIAEIKVTSYGLLSLGGVVSLVLGSLLLFDSPIPYLRPSLYTIGYTVLLTSFFFLTIVALAVRAYRSKPTTGKEGLVGLEGEAVSRISPYGKIFAHGEYWNAYSDTPVEKGERVKIIEVRDLKLRVEKIEKPQF
ncbi:MAG: nodulation protein NfeD [Thermodesulfobacteriota bacterium]|nr:nodulation protein NfeD [Thermodesulfobacteriota bacterium]